MDGAAARASTTKALARKVNEETVTRAVDRLQPDLKPIEVFREVGGAGLVAIAGAVIEARHRSVPPVLLDGYVTTAAVLPLGLERPGALDHCPGGPPLTRAGTPARLMDNLGLQPLLDLGLRLGEGTGTLAAVPLLQLAAAAVTEVATFADWGLAAVNGFLGAVSFLTRVPTGTGTRRPEELAAFVPWFPAVGAGVGLAVAAVYAGAGQLLPPLPAASLAVVAGICVTGAFHEDGLGDTADAFAGGHDRDSTVRILKDPRLGTFGVLAVAASLLLRAGAVAALTPAAALAALPAAHALSRAAAVADHDRAAARPPRPALGPATPSPCPAAGPWPGPWPAWPWPWPCSACPPCGRPRPPGWPPFALGRLAVRRIGGVSGDVLGAVQQLGEILVLLVAVAATGAVGGNRRSRPCLP